jgi:hypothetical protein
MGSCAGRIFVLWLPTEAAMAIRFEGRDDRGMSDDGDGTWDDAGADEAAEDDVIVAEYSDGSQVAVVDTNQDRLADVVAVDRDGDGTPEVVYTDEHGGPALDTATFDIDGDGRADAVAIDRDGDGYVDEVDLDRDGDGKIDMIILDDDFDHRPDHLMADPAHDGRVQAAEPEEPELWPGETRARLGEADDADPSS